VSFIPWDNPWGVALDADDFLYISSGTEVNKLAPNNSVVATFTNLSCPQSPGSIVYPKGLRVDSSATLYISAVDGNDRWACVISFAGNGTQLSTFTTRTSMPVFVDDEANIFSVESMNNRVVKLDPQGNVLAIYNTSNPKLSAPVGVVIDNDGNLLIADMYNRRLVKLAPDNTQLLVEQFNSTTSPCSLQLDGLGSIYSTINVLNAAPYVAEFSPDFELLSVLETSNPPLNAYWAQLAFDTANNLYVADAGNNRIVVFPTEERSKWEQE